MTDSNDFVTWDTTGYNQADFQGSVLGKYPIYQDYVYGPGAPPLNRPANDRLLRYGEVYLLLAEAYLRGSGSEAEAKALINELRVEHVYMGNAINGTDRLGVDDLIAAVKESLKNK